MHVLWLKLELWAGILLYLKHKQFPCQDSSTGEITLKGQTFHIFEENVGKAVAILFSSQLVIGSFLMRPKVWVEGERSVHRL